VVNKPPFEYAAAIAEHSAGLARAAEGNLDATVEHCPGWTVADLVDHVTQVHWFWATIVEDRLDAPPAEERHTRAEPDQLISTFRAGANRLVKALRAAELAEPVYTWAAAQKDVAFVARHQVLEAAVHHWAAAHAAGRPLAIATPVAVDSVEEFLTFSVSSGRTDDDGQTSRGDWRGETMGNGHSIRGGEHGYRRLDVIAGWPGRGPAPCWSAPGSPRAPAAWT
jgi:uncharacterized protein (TIGR03083 family)